MNDKKPWTAPKLVELPINANEIWKLVVADVLGRREIPIWRHIWKEDRYETFDRKSLDRAYFKTLDRAIFLRQLIEEREACFEKPVF